MTIGIRHFLVSLIMLVFTSNGAWAQSGSISEPPPPYSFQSIVSPTPKQFVVKFDSPVQTKYVENNSVVLHVSLPAERSEKVPVVIIAHYWGATDLKNESDMSDRLASRGIASIIIELPYHLSRTPYGTRSGQLAIEPDPYLIRKSMTQAVLDIRRTVDWAEFSGLFDNQKIGIVGTSLGAVVSSIAFGVEPRFSCYCSVLGGGDVAAILWSSSRLVKQREVLRNRGWKLDSLRKELVEIEPLNYLKKDDVRPAYFILARYDTVIPVESQRLLSESTGDKPKLWLDTGHYGGFLVQPSVQRTVANFFSETFRGIPFEPPSRLFAPTIRLASIAAFPTGLQVGVGLDLWKSNENADGFGTLMLTPKGPQGFIGYKLKGGFAIGVSITPKRSGPGILWNFVL